MAHGFTNYSASTSPKRGKPPETGLCVWFAFYLQFDSRSAEVPAFLGSVKFTLRPTTVGGANTSGERGLPSHPSHAKERERITREGEI